MLGTGYSRFTGVFGISGLVKVRPERLDLLAVVAERPGEGNFRAFIQQAKMEYPIICVWSIDNLTLYRALERYGFSPEVEICFDWVPIKGLRWDKN